MAPATYGGTVISWAFVLLKPIALVIVGRVNLVPVVVSPVFRYRELGRGGTVRTSRLTQKHIRLNIQPPITQNTPDILPPEPILRILLLQHTTLLDKPLQLQEPDLICVQPLGSSRRVNQQEERRHAQDNSRQALNDENPAPARVPSNAVHFRDCGGEEAGKCAG